MHVIDEVHSALWRQSESASFDVECAVGEDVDVAVEAYVLRVVGSELEVVALLPIDDDGVLQEVAVEAYGIVAYGAYELQLEETHVVLVDIDVLEYILQRGV